jgi:CubicO group peptidase (beta-lactamase class C family)
VTGVTLGRFFHDEIAEPLGADFHIGLGEEHDVRVADVIPPPPDTKLGGIEPTPLMEELGLNPPNNPLATRTRAWRAAEIPAAGGHGNARSVAAIQSILANGGYANGKSFLSEAGCRKALEVQVEGTDLVLGIPVRFGLGFAVAGEIIDLPSPNSIFWGGYGGSLVIVDFDRRASIAYAMNRMGTAIMGDPRAMALADRVFEVLPR